MIIYNKPVPFYEEETDELSCPNMLSALHEHVSALYPELFDITPRHCLYFIGQFDLIIYEYADIKKCFYCDVLNGIDEFIYAIYAEVDTRAIHTDEEINDAFITLFNLTF